MFGITEYLLAAVGAVALTTGGWGYMQQQRADNLGSQLLALRGELVTCGGRLQNIIEDMESDNAIDQLTDDQLTDVPAHWLLPVQPTPAGDN